MYKRATCCKAVPKKRKIPIEKDKYTNFFLSLLNSDAKFFFYINKKIGNKEKRQLINITPLKANSIIKLHCVLYGEFSNSSYTANGMLYFLRNSIYLQTC